MKRPEAGVHRFVEGGALFIGAFSGLCDNAHCELLGARLTKRALDSDNRRRTEKALLIAI